MKLRHITLVVLFAMCSVVSYAKGTDKVVLVDMEYVLKAVPAYESANEQLNLLSQKWQKEVEALLIEAQTMYKNYQTEQVFLSPEMKTERENQIIAKEKEADDLRRAYFGPEGELYKKRESLIKPIQEEIYLAIQELSESMGYDLILDKASSNSILFASPKIDISDALLERLGYSSAQ